MAALITVAGLAWAQDAMKVTIVAPDALTWKDNPNIPKGVQVTILLGDPTDAGEVVVQRVTLPANYQVPPHTHPYAETVTVISGSVGLGMGETFEKKGEMGKPGTFYAHDCVDRQRGGDHPSAVDRAGRHRLHQPGRRST